MKHIQFLVALVLITCTYSFSQTKTCCDSLLELIQHKHINRHHRIIIPHEASKNDITLTIDNSNYNENIGQSDAVKQSSDDNESRNSRGKSSSNDADWKLIGTLVTAFAAFIALLGTLISTIYTNKSNSANIEKQIQASKDNLQAQIDAEKKQDIEKRNAELQFKLKNELKEIVGKFIYTAQKLNGQLNEIILSDFEEGRVLEAEEKYSKTITLRKELTDLYYSIKVTLDGSREQQQLERIIDNYMSITCFKFELKEIKVSDYDQIIPQLFHKIKSIIHENYQEPM